MTTAEFLTLAGHSALSAGILITVIALSVYDAKTRVVPNVVTLPMIGLGFALNFPGSLEAWVISVIVYTLWQVGGTGGGDAKLWMGLAFLTPAIAGNTAIYAFGFSLIITSLAQMLFRFFKKTQITGQKSPAAWRAIPYALWLISIWSF